MKNGWISVHETKPYCSIKKDSFGVPVLVYQPTNLERTVFEAFYGRRVTSAPNFYLYGALLDDVVAWQLLPPPPL